MRRIWAVVLVLDLIALAVLGRSLMGLFLRDFLWGVLVAGILTWTELNPLNISDEGDLTVGELVQLAALISLGLQPTLIGVVLGEIAYSTILRRPLVKSCFNAGQTVVSVALAQWVFNLVGGVDGQLAMPVFAMAIAYVLTNTVLVAGILSLSNHQPFGSTWVGLNQDTLAYSAILSIGGLAFAGLILAYNWLGVFMAAVLLLCLRAVLAQAGNHLRAMAERFKHTVKVLMTALEYRDPYTYGHTSRVASWCRKIALEMDQTPEEVDLIELGGLLHDVGKVGVPEGILNNPGKLSKEEFAKIKAHPLIGERIILGMEGMGGIDRLAAMARQHHVFYNGDVRGYPGDESVDQLYIGSRILSVADTWDAMAADRPYRKALSHAEAVQQLEINSGTQFDPEVVAAFLRVLEHERLHTDADTMEGGTEADAGAKTA